MSQFGKLRFGRTALLQKVGLIKCQRNTFSTSRIAFYKYQTMQEVRDKLIKILKADFQYTTEPKSREYLLKYLPKSQDEIPVRKMKDSFDVALVPLSSDFELRDKYTTFLGRARLGRLMEDMDLFAGYIAYKHILIPKLSPNSASPVVVVTIKVDRTDFLKNPESDADIRLSGHVTWVGISSLEVVVWLDQQIDGKWRQITRALLLMAARNSLNTAPGIVNRLEADTPEEKTLIQGGEERKMWRKKKVKESLLNKVPTEEELHLIHDLFIETMDSKEMFKDKRVLPKNSKWMEDATSHDLVFCHPEHRNLHNKIFGGFLIRQALELSWTVAFSHCSKVPDLIHISDIAFYSPVEVGSLVKMFASVTYTEGEYAQIFVYAEAYSILHRQGKSTTEFNFTYKLGKEVDRLYPSTYLEAMKYIAGRRHFFEVMKNNSEGIKRLDLINT